MLTSEEIQQPGGHDKNRPADVLDPKDVEPVEPAPPRPMPFWHLAMPVFACGAGLFSDGYINNVSVLL